MRYDGGFVLDAGDGFKLKLGARVQTRYQWLSADGETERDNQQVLTVHRARIKMEGSVLDPRLTFKYQSDFGRGAVELKDFVIAWKIADGVGLQGGQFKRPYSRHFITSSGDLVMVERAITDAVLPTDRDVGVQIGSGHKGRTVEWALGLFNGAGENEVPSDFDPALVVRVGYNPMDFKAYSEADLEGGDFRLAVAANAHTDLNATSDDDPAVVAGVDAMVKVFRFGLLVEAHRDFDAEFNALMAQAGYLIAQHYEPAARYALIMPDGKTPQRQELSLGFSIYFFGHDLKWQTDFSLLDREDGAGGTVTDGRLRSQVQLAF